MGTGVSFTMHFSIIITLIFTGVGANAAEETIGHQIGGRPRSRQDRIVIPESRGLRWRS